MADNHGAWLITAIAMFLPWSILTFGVRAWAKLTSKAWGLDDYCISCALASAIAHVAVTCSAIQHGYGLPKAEIPDRDFGHVETSLYASQMLYILSVGLCRASAAFFIARITYLGPRAKPAYMIASSSALWTVISMLVIAFRGPLDRPWEVLESTGIVHSRWIGIEATGIAIDLGLWALSIQLVCSLQMKVTKRLFIICAFGARLGTIPIIICRVMYMAPRENSDSLLAGIIPSILTQGAIHFSIMAGCITCLRPFLQTFNATCTVESRGTATRGVSGEQCSYYKLETFKRVQRSAIDSSDSANWRPFQGSDAGHTVVYPAKIHLGKKEELSQHLDSTSQHLSRDPRARLGDEMMAGDVKGWDRPVILRTTEVSVHTSGETSSIGGAGT